MYNFNFNSKNSRHVDTDTVKQSVENLLSFCSNHFQNIGTEFRLFKNLLSNSTFTKPITFNVNNKITEVIKNNRPTQREF